MEDVRNSEIMESEVEMNIEDNKRFDTNTSYSIKRYVLKKDDIDSFILSKEEEGCEFVRTEELGDSCYIVLREPD